MQFASLLLFAATALAGSVHFVNQDSTKRTIIFTANLGLEAIPRLTIAGHATANQDFPKGWTGNFYSVSEGAKDVPGMLGEVRFNGFAGATYFDVSAIVNPDDHEGVKEIFPLHSNTPVSGCQKFPCDKAYNTWDDVQTQATDAEELVCLLGTLSNERRRSTVARMTREFVTS